MNKFKLIMLGMALSLFSSVLMAEYLVPGKVSVSYAANLDQYRMYGALNVGHNPDNTNNAYVVASDSDVFMSVNAKSSYTGEFFSCLVYKSNPNYATYRDRILAAGNGATLTAQAPTLTGSECSRIDVQLGSHSLQ